MGARVYLPGIGRFAQVDPIEGGVENNYVYPTDPVNEFDLTGEAVWFAAIAACVRFCKHIPKVVKVAKKINQAAKSRVAKFVANKYNNGKARKFLDDVAYDLKGKAHFDKTLKKLIQTPHKKTYLRSPRGSGSWGPTRPMNWKDMYNVYRKLGR